MPLTAGTRLGPYEIVAPLGAGGMGEVYRARDTRLPREVALKILPAEFAVDPVRRQRFEQEARAASTLNHPNIVHVYDLGSSTSLNYIAMELVEGRSLRDLLASGPLPPRRLLNLAIEIAEGLSKAHAEGIVHRDLKPENLLVTAEGHVKILDFGLAKLTPAASGDQAEESTSPRLTQAGMVLGTLGYMSPEQASGNAVDFRSDQFAFGSILYEMASGKRAFQRPTGAETLAAIIRDEPESLSRVSLGIPLVLQRIVEERCLAKNPQERYASTWDLFLDLRSARDHLSDASLAPAHPSAPPKFWQVSFGRGTIWSARFAPDGQTVLFGAAWDGHPVEPFLTRLGGPESRPLGFAGAEVLGVSSSGEIAISLERRHVRGWQFTGMLARVALAGGSPRPILEDVQYADWGLDAKRLAVVREVGGKTRLEYPIGTVLYETTGWISHPRVSKGDDRVAFLDHPLQGDDRGFVAVVDRSGTKRTLTEEWASEMGLAWSSGGDEVWFTAVRSGNSRAIHAVTLAGIQRTIAAVPGMLTLHDVSKDGRVLLARDGERTEVRGIVRGSELERDLSALDHSVAIDLSPDGSTLVVLEPGEGVSANYVVYLKRTEADSPPILLGEGYPLALSPDGNWVLVILPSERKHLILLPTGAGDIRHLEETGLEYQRWARFLPDGRRVVCEANEPGRAVRLYVQDLEGGQARAVSPEGVNGCIVSPDGSFVAAFGPDKKPALYPLEGGQPRAISGVLGGEIPVRFTSDGRSFFVFRRGELPARVFRVDLPTGRRELWKELVPSDPVGLREGVLRFLPTPDGRHYVYDLSRILSELYVAEGLR